jgi:hypothetical protein
VRSEAGSVRGQLTADVQAPDFSARGDLDVDRLNLAPILRDPAQRTNLTGHAKLDVSMKSSPSTARVADRMTGTFAFSGPHVLAAGYEARDVKVSGSIDGSRISVNGSAVAMAAPHGAWRHRSCLPRSVPPGSICAAPPRASTSAISRGNRRSKPPDKLSVSEYTLPAKEDRFAGLRR